MDDEIEQLSQQLLAMSKLNWREALAPPGAIFAVVIGSALIGVAITWPPPQSASSIFLARGKAVRLSKKRAPDQEFESPAGRATPIRRPVTDKMIVLISLRQFHRRNCQIYVIDGRMISVDGRWLADFASCNYLGFDLDREIIETIPATSTTGARIRAGLGSWAAPSSTNKSRKCSRSDGDARARRPSSAGC
jgi:hypothetical protein